jgi:hypothetical protein
MLSMVARIALRMSDLNNEDGFARGIGFAGRRMLRSLSWPCELHHRRALNAKP